MRASCFLVSVIALFQIAPTITASALPEITHNSYTLPYSKRETLDNLSPETQDQTKALDKRIIDTVKIIYKWGDGSSIEINLTNIVIMAVLLLVGTKYYIRNRDNAVRYMPIPQTARRYLTRSVLQPGDATKKVAQALQVDPHQVGEAALEAAGSAAADIVKRAQKGKITLYNHHSQAIKSHEVQITIKK